MNFSFDSELIARARQLILHGPNLAVLRPEHEGQYSPLVVAIETELKKREAAGLLLLPDLSALSNSTVGIFSDYSGEGAGSYLTYSFLMCAYGSIDTFRQKMKRLRAEYALGSKEIEFKDFRMTALRNALPAYLNLLNGYVPGLLFTVVVDRRILSLFGPQERATGAALSRRLEEQRFAKLKPEIAEKALRVRSHGCLPDCPARAGGSEGFLDVGS